jgi:hypothetical protein
MAVGAGLLAVVLASPTRLAAGDDSRRASSTRPSASSRSDGQRGSSSSAARDTRPSARDTRPSQASPRPGGGRTRIDDVASGVGGRHRFDYRHYYHRNWNDFYWGWYGYWGFPYYYHYYPPYYGGAYVRDYRRGGYGRGDWGALDLDLKPGKTEIYLDGQYVGTADDFDGFPTYLWLEEGTYDLVFYYPGFRTLARQYSIYPGLIIDVGDRLEPGESIRPEDLPAQTHERRDARIRQDREMAAEADAADRRARDWRERYPQEEAEAPATVDVRGEPSRLEVSVEPGDASVYLDGRFVGTGEEIARLRGGLIIDPGEHVLEVVRPGRRSHSERFTAEAGDSVELDIELEDQ